MKLVKALSEPFSFPYDGSLTFEITTEGTLVPDFVADSMVNRFHVSIEETSVPAEDVENLSDAPTALTMLSLEALKGLAKEKGINLGDAKKKADIIEVLKAALEAGSIVAPETEVVPQAPTEEPVEVPVVDPASEPKID